MKYLYHLTKPEYLDQILAEGIKPIIGDNSKLVDDMVPICHMCERKDLPYWNLLLDKPGALLKINSSYLYENEILERDYHLYKEKMYSRLIPKEAVSVVNGFDLSLENIDVARRQEFKLSVINSVSGICELISRLVLNSESEYFLENYKDVKICASTARRVISLIDFTEITPKKLQNELIRLVDDCGVSTFCDLDYINFDSDMRLYEYLQLKPYATEDTKWLYSWLVSNYYSILDSFSHIILCLSKSFLIILCLQILFHFCKKRFKIKIMNFYKVLT